MNDIHENIENDEFETKFETVNDCFENCLNKKQINVFCNEKNEIQKNDENVHSNKMMKNFSKFFFLKNFVKSKNFANFLKINVENDRLLNDEINYLNFFVNVINFESSNC